MSEDTIEYEAPTDEEKQTADAAGIALLPEITPEQRARMEEEDFRYARLESLRLAVAWTAPMVGGQDELGAEAVGHLFGLAALMGKWVADGKKPTRTEIERSLKPFRR